MERLFKRERHEHPLSETWIHAEQVYAIGDAENDIDMLRATKHGYTFHHSPATVKQYAEGCVKSVSELIDKICNLD